MDGYSAKVEHQISLSAHLTTIILEYSWGSNCVMKCSRSWGFAGV